MPNNKVTPREMLSYLIVDQEILKAEIASVLRISFQVMNQIINGEGALRKHQSERLQKLYWRIRAYEDQLNAFQNDLTH